MIQNNTDMLYDGFKYRPYLKIETLKQYKNKLIECERNINRQLIKFKNYDGLDFCDVNAGGIQIRLHHKAIQDYSYGNQYTIFYDFSNIDSICDVVVNEWKNIDNEESINRFLNFIKDIKWYGCD